MPNNTGEAVVKESAIQQRSSKISSSEIWYTIEGCISNQRTDGRACTDIRKYNTVSLSQPSSSSDNDMCESSSSFTLFSNASSRVTLSSCTAVDIMTSIKGEIVPSSSLLAGQQQLVEYSVDYISSNTQSDKRHCREMSHLLACLLGSNPIPTDKLTVLQKEYYWKLYVDVSVLSDEGIGKSSILDVMSMAIYAAFQNLKLPNVIVIKKSSHVKDEFILQEQDDLDNGTNSNALLTSIWDQQLSTSFPIIVTVCLIRDNANKQVMILDATMEEEECSFMKISYAINSMGIICGTRTHHHSSYDTGGLPFTTLANIMDIVNHGSSSTFTDILGAHDDDDRDSSLSTTFHLDKQFLNSQFYVK